MTSTKAGITGNGFQTETLPASTLIKGLANRDGFLLIGVQPPHRIDAPISGQRQGGCIGKGQQPRRIKPRTREQRWSLAGLLLEILLKFIRSFVKMFKTS